MFDLAGRRISVKLHVVSGDAQRELLAVESEFCLAHEFPVHRPVILAVHPGPHDELRGVLGQLVDPDNRLRIFEHFRVSSL